MIKLSMVILCVEAKKWVSSYVHIYIFCIVVYKKFFSHSPNEYEYF